MRDPNPPFKIQTYSFCLDYKGQPKPISPAGQRDAVKMPDGSYKCLTCQEEELKDRTIRVTPNSDRAREIIQEREADKRFKQRERISGSLLGDRNERNRR